MQTHKLKVQLGQYIKGRVTGKRIDFTLEYSLDIINNSESNHYLSVKVSFIFDLIYTKEIYKLSTKEPFSINNNPLTEE